MKITFFLYTDIRAGRGTEEIVLNLVKHRPPNVSISIVQTDFFDRIRLSEEQVRGVLEQCEVIKFHSNIPHHSFKTTYGHYLDRVYLDLIKRPIRRDLKSLRNTSTLEKIRDTDIVYLLHNEYAIFFGKTGIPVIGSDQTDSISGILKKQVFYKKVYYKILYILYYRNINGCQIFPSNKDILEKMPFRYKFVMPNGVDTNIFYPKFDEKHDKVKFLFVGALNSGKGLDILLPLIRSLNMPSAEFHIYGSGPLEEEIKETKNIKYHGDINEDNKAKLYRECDVFIYPSRVDSFGIVVLEALASGLYVLLSDLLKGNFDDFEGKYLEYLPRNVDAFKNRVIEILNNRDTITHDKKEEYKYVKEHFDWKVISEGFYSNMTRFYEESEKSNLGNVSGISEQSEKLIW